MRPAASCLLLIFSAGVLHSQETPFWQPEVRRAIPVEKPSSTATPTPKPKPEPPVAPAVPFDYDNPAWMQKVQPTPAPSAPAQPGPEPGFTPFRPQGRVEVSPTPEAQPPPAAAPTPVAEDGEIRLSPSNATGEMAAEAELNAANSIFARKMYDYAIPEYEKFLVAYPEAKGRDMALFRLAECHRMLGNIDAARAGYERLLMEFHEGEFAGAGAYRLGEYLYAEKKYDPALIQFRLAASQATSDEVRLTALYNSARCLDRLQRPEEATKIYEEVAAVEKNNPYRDYARLALAEIAAAAGRKKEALADYEKIASGSAKDSASTQAVRAEAGVKAASLAAELGDKEKALKFFQRTLDLNDSGDWKAIAFLGALRLHYDLGHYKEAVAMGEKPPSSLPDEAKAEALLLTGNSYRQLGNARAARAVYDRLLLQFPDSDPSRDALFDRLLSMYQLDDPKLLEEADKFLKQATDPRQRAQASLLKAETLFKQQKYAEALPLYAGIPGSPLAADIKNKALYKIGWCQAQTGDHAGAIKTYTDYIEKNAGAASLPSAIVQRGLSLQNTKDYAAALKDFDLLIDKYAGSPEREIALQQKALILGQQQDYKGMTAAFRQLLADYPKSPGAGQANFWIGWAAFEEKDYKNAIANFEAARKLDPAQYGERSVLRMYLCYYYLENRPALLRLIAENKSISIPLEITRWLGRKSFDEGDYEGAANFLLPVVNNAKTVEPDVLIELAEAQIALGKAREAAPHVAKYLETAHEPSTRARGLLASGRIALASGNFEEAVKHSEEALLLQPEGRLNAEGRLLTGEIAFAKGDYDGAARAFMTVALLYDDTTITPRALRRAADAYRKADNLLEAEKALHELQQRFPDFQKSSKISRKN